MQKQVFPCCRFQTSIIYHWPDLLEFNEMKQEDILSFDQLIFLQRKRKSDLLPFTLFSPENRCTLSARRKASGMKISWNSTDLNREKNRRPEKRFTFKQWPVQNRCLKNAGSVKTGTSTPYLLF